MSDITIRPGRSEELSDIVALNDRAFGGPEEGRVTRALWNNGDTLLSLVAVKDGKLVGHIEMFRIRVDGADCAAGLGPMSIHPDYQKTGIGSALVRRALASMHSAQRLPVFVLGHPDYYPRFGFSAAAAEAFSAPWSGPAFMAWSADEASVSEGKLTYPRAFAGDPPPNAA